MDDIYALKDQLLCLNTVPVICHEESNEKYEKYINTNSTTKKFAELYHLERASFETHFKLKRFKKSLGEVVSMLGGSNEFFRIKKLGYILDKSYFTKSTENMLAATFVIFNNQVVSEFRKEHKYQRFDIARVVLDTDDIGVEVHTSFFECQKIKKEDEKTQSTEKEEKVEEKVKQEETKTEEEEVKEEEETSVEETKTEKVDQEPKVEENKPEQIEEPKEVKNEEIKTEKKNTKKKDLIPLSDVLSSPKNFKFFKLYSTSENKVGYVVFYEEIQKYKQMKEKERKTRIEQIFQVFLTKDSKYFVDGSKEQMRDVNSIIKKGEAPTDCFDPLVDEVVKKVFEKMYDNFVKSKRYESMTNTNPQKVNYLLVK